MGLKKKLIAYSGMIIPLCVAVTGICAVVYPGRSANREDRMVQEWKAQRLAEHKARAKNPCVLFLEAGQTQPIFECYSSEGQ